MLIYILAGAAAFLIWKLFKRERVAVPAGLKLPVKVKSPSYLPLAIEYGKQPTHFMLWAKKNFGPVVDLDLTLTRFVFVFDPELSNKLYSWNPAEINFEEGITQLIKHIFGDTIYDNAEWNKKSVGVVKQGLMTNKSLTNFKPLIQEETDKIINDWITSGEVELSLEASNMVLRMALRIMLGDYIYDNYRDVLINDFRGLEINGFSSLTFLLPNLPFASPKDTQVYRSRLYKLLGEYIRNDAEKYVEEHPDSIDYMSSFLRGKNHELAGIEKTVTHMISLLFAFHANTAGTFAWAMIHLVHNKNAREKVVQEYQDNIAKGVDMSEVNNFPYMRAVTRETNRRYGSAMHIRKAVKDTQLGDYFIPKGRLIAASSWVNGNDPELATNPEEWNPDRFFENQKFLQYFNPFGSGWHPCMGEKIAYMIFINAIPRMFIDYQVTPKNPELPRVDWQRSGFYFPKDPYYVTVTKK
jgi:cytochrome P450